MYNCPGFRPITNTSCDWESSFVAARPVYNRFDPPVVRRSGAELDLVSGVVLRHVSTSGKSPAADMCTLGRFRVRQMGKAMALQDS